MSDFNTPIVRLVSPAELPVRIPDWPEAVGIAICRAGGRIISLQPYHLQESGTALKRRLVEEAGDSLRGFAVHPGLKGLPAAKLSPAEDLHLLSELEQSLRSMPRLVEEVADFAINFEFAAEEGLSLDGLSDQARRKGEDQPGKASDQLPVGYHAFVKSDTTSEVISGAVLRPVGAQGVDLLLADEKQIPLREIPPEAQVLVREDSLRVAIPLAALLENGRLPRAIRLPAGSLLPPQGDGRPVPALVLRRGGFLFVAPDYSALAHPALTAASATKRRRLPWLAIGIGAGAVALVAAIAATTLLLLAGDNRRAAPLPPVEGLRENLFAPRAG
ncbi:hypothetical protein [Pseudogemmobacter faecipullorum]|uniref:Uncharacterized protein n=1 Tax=Pseudogemmobacter faecipullorum TaxID=2755041 RepID=A0ABS8CN89_9RHOB|nr:hypothetical protein [Pseudogemmobacter faecipullorum]MCB5410872.1 hypothetical protein [Pseudogemmobacter faecipullorum]